MRNQANSNGDGICQSSARNVDVDTDHFNEMRNQEYKCDCLTIIVSEFSQF